MRHHPPRLCRNPTKTTPRSSFVPVVLRPASSGHSGGVLVIVAPGQGAQTPGFLAPWLEGETFAGRLAWLSAVADMDLVHYGTDADADTIRDTAVAQPLEEWTHTRKRLDSPLRHDFPIKRLFPQ